MKQSMRAFPCLLFLLLSLVSCGPGHGRYARLLEEAEWMNRNDSLFTTDSVMLRVVRHYDHWWYNRNTRMKAYYLLGSAYRDLGEAPAAIHYYNMAVERADTLSPDCDFATLFRVYGQMAMVYGFQNMPWEKREAIEHYKHFALLAGDTLSSIIAYGQMADVCYQLDDSLGVFANTDSAVMLFNKYGYENYAPNVYPLAIYLSIEKGQYARAKSMMDIYEKDGWVLDDNGNIAKGFELYGEYKGKYYLGVDNLDSAEYYYRRLLSSEYKKEAYRGLSEIYAREEQIDSVVKYTPLYEDALLLWATQRQSESVIQSSALYKYTRNQNLAEQKARDVRISHQIILILLVFLLILLLIVFSYYKHIRQRALERELEYHKLVEQHITAQAEYHEKCEHLSNLQHDYDALLHNVSAQNQKLLYDKQQEIDRLTEALNAYRNEILEKEGLLKSEDIVVLFRMMSHSGYNGKNPTRKEWVSLEGKYKHYMPHLYARMKVACLSEQELYSSILTHLGFSTGDMVVLLKTSQNTVSNAKQSANEKLFGEKTALTLAQNLKKCAYFQ